MDVSVKNPAAGFSLIELVMVLLIIAIVGVTVLVRTTSSATINLGAQAQQIANDIRYAQALAMSKNQRFYFIRQSATTYQVMNQTGTAIIFPAGGTTVTLNTGITFGTFTNLPNNLVAFDGLGTPYINTTTPGTALAATATIPITGGGNTQTISIVRNTGQVSIS